MNSATKLVPFPLFHGSSNHYLSSFKLGSTPVAWSHKDTALRLLREVWDDLDRLRDQVATDAQEKLHWDITHERVPWFVQRVVDQSSSFSSNWQHGELYLTPSKRTAVSYACGGSRYGGELLRMCRDAIDVLAEVDYQRADELVRSSGSLERLIRGTELPPILVEFGNIKPGDLSTETQDRDVCDALSVLTDAKLQEALGSAEAVRELHGPGVNFRLSDGCGTVMRVYEVHVADIDNPSSSFSLQEVKSSDQWK